MDSSEAEVDHEFLPFLRVYNDGQVERLLGTEFVPPCIDSHTAVSSKDVVINTETGLSARLYIPKIIDNEKRVPLLIYFHGGAFVIESAFSPLYHNYLISVVQEANVVVSVEYRLAPENPLPIVYDDSWEAIQWVASNLKGDGQDPWLRDYADTNRVFLGGDSAGANIVHNMAVRAGEVNFKAGLKFLGVILVQPYFWGVERIGYEGSDLVDKSSAEKMWVYACPSTTGNDDPRINPAAEGAPSLCNLWCNRVLVFIAGKDVLRDRGLLYSETLKKSGWGGVVEVIETEGEDHVFHLFNPTCDKAIIMMKNLVSFMNQEKTPT